MKVVSNLKENHHTLDRILANCESVGISKLVIMRFIQSVSEEEKDINV